MQCIYLLNDSSNIYSGLIEYAHLLKQVAFEDRLGELSIQIGLCIIKITQRFVLLSVPFVCMLSISTAGVSLTDVLFGTLPSACKAI